MPKYNSDERIFLMKTYLSTQSLKKTQDQFVEHFDKLYPSRSTILKLAKKLNTTGSVANAKRSRSTSVRTSDTVQLITTALRNNPEKSVRKLAFELGISHSTVQRIVKDFGLKRDLQRNMDDNDNKCVNDYSLEMTLKECLPLPLSDEVIDEIVEKAKDFALLHGAGIRYRSNYDPEIMQMAPFFLLPSAFPRREFERVVKLQPLVNLLVHRTAHNFEFLHRCLQKTILVDEFTKRLWDIYTTVREEGFCQSTSIGLLRCDYFFSVPCQCAKQVEINTVACSFGALTTKIGLVHRYVVGELQKPDLLKQMPPNTALEDLCQGMLSGWDIYGNSDAVILFVIEDVTYNICDQRFHEYTIRALRPDVLVIRKTLTQLYTETVLTQDKRLIVNGKEVAVVYFRAGYEPGHYHGEEDWEARLRIEQSLAIKCPSIQYHLAGTKKVQQELTTAGMLEKFLTREEADSLRQLFAGLYTLDHCPEGDLATQMAMEDPEKFVLKPQREGGGNNVYGMEIKAALEKMHDQPEREGYILMERIFPPVQRNYLVRPHQPVQLGEVISELGVFGVIIGTAENVTVNKFAGHMLRTKFSTANEGGVAAGFGALDSVFLVD